MTKNLIKEFPSKYNGTIQLFQEDGALSVEVGGFVESGDPIEEIWKDVCTNFYEGENPDTILILGFGTGSIMKAIRDLWPSSQVTGIEIDPNMITIAKKYFPLNIKGVTLVTGNAVDYVRKLPDTKSIDLIIMDCYIGGTEPDNMKTLKFLRKLKRASKRVLLNQLFLPNQPAEMAKIDYLRELDTQYAVRILKLPYNMIIEY